MQVRLQELGSGSDVVLLYGSPTPRRHFDALARELSRHQRVLIVDLPGHGDCPAATGDYCMTDSLEALENSLAARLKSDPALVGFSSGGYRALALACRGTIQPRAVCVLAGMACLSEAGRREHSEFAELVLAGVDLAEAAVQRFLPRSLQCDPAVVEEVRSWITLRDRTLARELRALSGAEDLRPALGNVRCPVVARTGADDAAVSPDYAYEIAALTGGRAEIVPGAGHLLLLEDFESTSASVARMM